MQLLSQRYCRDIPFLTDRTANDAVKNDENSRDVLAVCEFPKMDLTEDAIPVTEKHLYPVYRTDAPYPTTSAVIYNLYRVLFISLDQPRVASLSRVVHPL